MKYPEDPVLRNLDVPSVTKTISTSFLASSDRYTRAAPFPHAIFHNILDNTLLDTVASEFPRRQSMGTHWSGSCEYEKYTESRWSAFGPVTRDIVGYFQSGEFLNCLSELTGITGLIADPHLIGGGQHMIGKGGFLKVHADFNHHVSLDLERRINVLLYLNAEWNPAWGGSLELWDTKMQRCVVSVVPERGTIVVFNTTSRSYHGHPDPLTVPDDITRKSLAFYYYSVARPVSESTAIHSTLFRKRPGLDSNVISNDLSPRLPEIRHHLGRARQHLGEVVRLLSRPRASGHNNPA